MEQGGSGILLAKGLSKRFGGLTALAAYRLNLAEGELLGLIGPNGAGKTTAFNLLTGVTRPSTGSITFRGEELAGRRPESFAAAGIARTFQNIRLFRELSAWENVAVGQHMREGPGWLATVLGLPGVVARERQLRAQAAELLALVGLADQVDRRAGDLPYGLQRKVEVARALATAPRLLLLDEPTAGMNATESAALVELLARLHGERGLTLVVVEHDMRVVMRLCRRIQVLDRGELLAEGAPAEIQQDPRVIAAYLGTGRRRVREATHA